MRKVLLRGGALQVFRGRPYITQRWAVGGPQQRGKGIGSFLANLFRVARPLLGKAGKAVAKQALATGLDIARDFAFDPETKRDPKATIRRRLGEAGDTLTEKFRQKVSSMTGSGRGGRSKQRRAPGSKKRKVQQRGGVKRRKVGHKKSKKHQRGGKRALPSAINAAVRRALAARVTKRKAATTKKQKRQRSAVDIFS